MWVWHPETQRPASWGRMALRDIIGRIVDGILSIITELISFIFMLSRPDRKTLHDLIAGTLMVRRSALGTNDTPFGLNTPRRA